MKCVILITALFITATSAIAQTDKCRSEAFKVAEAIHAVYVPKLSPYTIKTAKELETSKNTVKWLISYAIFDSLETIFLKDISIRPGADYLLDLNSISCFAENVTIIQRY